MTGIPEDRFFFNYMHSFPVLHQQLHQQSVCLVKVLSEESNVKVLSEESNVKVLSEESNVKVLSEESNVKELSEESNALESLE